MTGQWRPEGWVKGGNPKIKGVQYHNYDTDSFEDGADAILEALRRIGLEVTLNDEPLGIEGLKEKESKGTYVFIPDEK